MKIGRLSWVRCLPKIETWVQDSAVLCGQYQKGERPHYPNTGHMIVIFCSMDLHPIRTKKQYGNVFLGHIFFHLLPSYGFSCRACIFLLKHVYCNAHRVFSRGFAAHENMLPHFSLIQLDIFWPSWKNTVILSQSPSTTSTN